MLPLLIALSVVPLTFSPFLPYVAGKLDAGDKQKITDAVESAIKWLEHNQEGSTEEYSSRQKELEGICNPIIAKVGGQSGDFPSAHVQYRCKALPLRLIAAASSLRLTHEPFDVLCFPLSCMFFFQMYPGAGGEGGMPGGMPDMGGLRIVLLMRQTDKRVPLSTLISVACVAVL